MKRPFLLRTVHTSLRIPFAPNTTNSISGATIEVQESDNPVRDFTGDPFPGLIGGIQQGPKEMNLKFLERLEVFIVDVPFQKIGGDRIKRIFKI